VRIMHSAFQPRRQEPVIFRYYIEDDRP
jgi:hypothetical protein